MFLNLNIDYNDFISSVLKDGIYKIVRKYVFVVYMFEFECLNENYEMFYYLEDIDIYIDMCIKNLYDLVMYIVFVLYDFGKF